MVDHENLLQVSKDCSRMNYILDRYKNNISFSYCTYEKKNPVPYKEYLLVSCLNIMLK